MYRKYTIINEEIITVEIYLENLAVTYHHSVFQLIEERYKMYLLKKNDVLSNKTLLIDYTTLDQLLFSLFNGRGLIMGDLIEDLMKSLRQQKIKKAMS